MKIFTHFQATLLPSLTQSVPQNEALIPHGGAYAAHRTRPLFRALYLLLSWKTQPN